MHRIDKKRPPDKQDKRTVVPIEREDWGTWLRGSPQQAKALVRVPPVEAFSHRALNPAQQVELALS